MDLPQEIELWHVIPLIRKLLVKDLKERGLKQKDIAVMMGITAPAVSQYIKEKRAKDCDLVISENVNARIHQAADNIINSKGDQQAVIKEINQLSNLFKDEKIICQIHMNKDDSFKECNICYEK